MSFSTLICGTLTNMPKHFQKSLTDVDPFNDSNDENGSIGWLRVILKTGQILRLPSHIRDSVMKRYVTTVSYGFMKNFINKGFTIPYDIDCGQAFFPDKNNDCYSILKGNKIVFTPEQISLMNERGNSPGSYQVIYGDPILNDDGSPSTYYLHEEHQNSGRPPFIHYKFVVDYKNPRVAGKFLNGGISNYDLLMMNCSKNGLSVHESSQHIETIIEYMGSIPVASSVEEQTKIMSDLIKMWDENPIPNRKTHHTITLNMNEMLYYVISRIDNPLIVQSILSSQYILDNYGTPSLIPALQKMYELISDGIPDGICIEKNCPYIEHPMVIVGISEQVKEIVDNLNHSLDIDKYLEISDELIEDIKTNCVDTMIRTFIGNVQKSIVIDEDNSEPVVLDTDKNESDENECQICFQPGGIPISTDEGDGYCKHTFHPRCLAQWALSTNCSNHNCCPTCRKPFG